MFLCYISRRLKILSCLVLYVMIKMLSSHLKNIRGTHYGLAKRCVKLCSHLSFENIYIRFGTNVYRQTVGIPMGTNCALLEADLFLFCYESGFMSLSLDEEAFNSTSRYLDDLLNIDNKLKTKSNFTLFITEYFNFWYDLIKIKHFVCFPRLVPTEYKNDDSCK